MEEERVFKKYLGKTGLKFTPERQAILKEICSLHEHFDAEKIFAKLRSKKKNISRATIYRTLPLLIKSGLIKEALRCGSRITYEYGFGHSHHGHLICIKCGKLVEVFDEQLERIQDKLSREKAFTPTHYQLNIYGICNKCGKNEGISCGDATR